MSFCLLVRTWLPHKIFFIHPEIKHSLVPHLEWFLLYLDRTPDTLGESPLVVIYAYSAFLMAWQMLLLETQAGGDPDQRSIMHVVGIALGDSGAAIRWAEDAFQPRRGNLIGSAILNNLATLRSQY